MPEFFRHLFEKMNSNVFLLNLCFQDRLTFRRIIVKNNAKKRRLYEAFIETLPLLTSLEVKINFVLLCKETADPIYGEN